MCRIVDKVITDLVHFKGHDRIILEIFIEALYTAP